MRASVFGVYKKLVELTKVRARAKNLANDFGLHREFSFYSPSYFFQVGLQNYFRAGRGGGGG